MEQTIVMKGETVQEAIHKALTLMKAEPDEVSIVIIENGGSRFLGLRKVEAVVQVTKKEIVPPDSNPSNAPIKTASPAQETEACIWIKSGQAVVSSTEQDKPWISPHPKASIYVNGVLLTAKKQVKQEDSIAIKLKETIRPFTWRLTEAEDGMSASLYVQPEKKVTMQLLDTSPQRHLKLEIKETATVNNSLTEQAVREELTEKKITAGIRESDIKKAVQTLEPGTFTVAEGQRAVEGLDGAIEFFVEVNRSFQSQLKEQPDGKVDYRESGFIPSVEEGTVIAKTSPPLPGTPGKTIKGEPILPKPVKKVIVRIGKGVEMVGENEITALMAGRPYVERRGHTVKIHLLKQYEHHGNVDLKSGNMYFDGDLVVQGSVEELMKVECKGSALIGGTVSGAAVQAGRSIQLKGNVFSSTISSGKTNMMVQEFSQNLLEITEYLMQLEKSLVFLLNEKKVKELSVSQTWAVFRLVAGRKNAPMMEETKQFIQKTARYHTLLDEEWEKLAMRLYKLFLTLPPQSKNVVDYLRETIKAAQQLLEAHQAEEEEEVILQLPYALKARLFSAGSVEVTGSGLYNCFVRSGHTITAADGCIRGGEIYAKQRIQVKSAGSETGVKTVLKTDETGVIEIDEAFEGTVIAIGHRRHSFFQREYKVRALINKDGHLIIR